MNAVQNERTKLTANLLNGVAAACIVAGGITPLVALLYGFTTSSQPSWVISAIIVAWITAGAVLHLGARAVLGLMLP